MTNTRADITIVGLGPGEPARRTVAAQAALDAAERIFVRGHEGVDLGDLTSRRAVTDIERLRQSDEAPGGRWHVAAQAVCDAAANGPVVLAIPGHPRFGEGLVDVTVSEAHRRGMSTEVVDGVSVVDLLATALGKDPLLHHAQFFNARMLQFHAQPEPFAGGAFTGSPRRPMVFTHVYDNRACRTVAMALERVLPSDHPIIQVEAAGMAGERISDHTVGELSTMAGGPLTALWVPALGDLDAGRDPRTLQHIVARLRRPDGCPWDRKQTNQTLRDSLIDEVYEVVDAINANDAENLAEELGDLLLLVMMHAQIAEEAGSFTLEDVYEGIATKIVRRHPHVFGDEAARSADEVESEIWKRVKDEERANGKRGIKAADGQPHSMPTLTRIARALHTHPVSTDHPAPAGPGGQMLALIAGIIDDGDDPDAVLRAALEQHVNHLDRDKS